MKLSIPEPCSEDWSKMTPTEQGAFCQKCALEVTDFTDKTALEIKEILMMKIASKQHVCGHIENRQLIDFNSEFIPWRSDQESFRAVWMFSLVAVFGMTMFSCQSNFSKEMVEQMTVNSAQMMEEDAKDTLDIAKLNDSLMLSNPFDSLDVSSIAWPLEIPFTTGPAMPFILGPDLFDGALVACPILLGNITIDGMLIDPGPIPEDPFDRAEFMLNPFSSNIAPNPKSPDPFTHDRPQQATQRLDAKNEKGKPDFAASISPIPIDKTSKLYLTIPNEGTLRLSIWDLSVPVKIHAESFDLVFGNHTSEINFMDFPAGKYATQLLWEEEKVVIPFEIFGKETV